ncbi:DNA-directed DNA polymerase gamma mip1 [Tulasnella sp. JGI-2019a]|nr:DNA-directed DNA polymerase gamma mip1 [Tulasnella sp. JGI-2019a]
MLCALRQKPRPSTLSYSITTSSAHTAQKLLAARASRPPIIRTQNPRNGLAVRHDDIAIPNNEKAVAPQTLRRNEVGVQLLSPSIHDQLFRKTIFPPADPSSVQIAREHLNQHGLDISQAAVLPEVSFTLPPLQADTLHEHFYRIGLETSEPRLSLATKFASSDHVPLPSPPTSWVHQPGWTKYYSDGTYEPVESLSHEQMLCFDVETLPAYHPYAIMACAVSPTNWYSWISPWLLGESTAPNHLIPLGDPSVSRIVVGHNVSYDRARVKEEYSLKRSSNRWIDTMALHIATKGISSHQRPSWMRRRKEKKDIQKQQEECVETVVDLMQETQVEEEGAVDRKRKSELTNHKRDLEEGLSQLTLLSAEDDVEANGKRWEDITSMNSLAEVAKLHCDVEMDKSGRSAFLTSTPEMIREKLDECLSYCATDVATTHAVYCQVLPLFRETCPSPVSWAGVMTMGNSFLGVNQSWEEYIKNAEEKYRELEDGLRQKLVALAEEARVLMDKPDVWSEDVWLRQLDWSPKVPKESRGVVSPPAQQKRKRKGTMSELSPEQTIPRWYRQLLRAKDFTKSSVSDVTVPLLLRLSWKGYPLVWSTEHGWVYRATLEQSSKLSDDPISVSCEGALYLLKPKAFRKLLGTVGLKGLQTGDLTCADERDSDLLLSLCQGGLDDCLRDRIISLAEDAHRSPMAPNDAWLSQLDWRPVTRAVPLSDHNAAETSTLPVVSAPTEGPPPVVWPKWYWELAAPKKGKPPGALDLTGRSRIAPLLLHLRWMGWPLFHSREFGWTFRVTKAGQTDFVTHLSPVIFSDEADEHLRQDCSAGYTFYKLPHKDGDKANVGSPLAKAFVKYAENGILASPGSVAKEALSMNAQCSYWISARDRVLSQMVVWDGENGVDMGFAKTAPNGSPEEKWGMILPQVITMGTVTRRAIEKTWLTASNAKANRVGSELKAMVRAPPGYVIVGADVDSEELWISSVMGDAQFGVHGATAIGWMTLEGQKKYGTDLHSKTASILGISRDEAKVFNYSRIYGAGMRHAALLLRQSNPNMSPEEAKKLAEGLYASTKGKNTYRKDMFGRKFWYGGTESFVFNKLEEIALSEQPTTPALGCGVTRALVREHLKEGFGSDFMPSRINWVVQSSGVDYLHLLIVAMEHLLSEYAIEARYLISVHDELRYLVREEDKYRCTLALQIANLWTRSLFALKLGMDDLPQSVAFFSAVDVDKVLRKEVDMPCVTPSQQVPIPPGEKLDIMEVLKKTSGGSLWKDRSVIAASPASLAQLSGYAQPECLVHRATGPAFLRAQCTSEIGEIRMLSRGVRGSRD